MVKAPSYSHPLDALTADEIKACSKACIGYAEEQDLGALRFNVVSLKVFVPKACNRQNTSGSILLRHRAMQVQKIVGLMSFA